jgi:hypothetical protein
VQILAEEPQDDSWPAIGQTHHDDGLAVESQGVLLNRNEFLVIAHLSPLSRVVYCTRPSCLYLLVSSVPLLL